MKWFYYFCKILGIKVIWEMHNIVPHDYNETGLNNSKWFYKMSDAIIFHSEVDIRRSKELLETNYDKKHIVISHGHLNNIYENRISKKEARNILGLPENKKVILCFGNIRNNRGYEYAIHATRDMLDTVIVIAGKTKDKSLIEKLLDYEKNFSNIRLFIKKWIPDEDLQIYFNACDIVVLPYTEITTSGVIPTAYAFSRPVISTSIGGIKEMVNENTGILVPPKDIHSLRQAIEKIFAMDYEAMGRYAYEYAGREFSWESNAQKIKALYESILCKN
jgi:glycosyltransferase involved in cell wall biosynthesis